MSQQNLFNLGLPKWPQLMIVGDNVTEEQAADIIFRTETFLTDSHEWSGGNNKAFNERYRRESGLEEITNIAGKDWCFSADAERHLRARIGFVDLEYIHNTWASSSFIGGPYGFCSPDGAIFYSDNIGKYPSVEAVYNDLCAIAKAFPYLNFKASLYSHEGGEEVDDRKVIVSFVVSCGDVTLNTEDYDLRKWYNPRSMSDMINSLNRHDREQGLPYKTVLDFQRRVKALIPECIEHAEATKVVRLREMEERQPKVEQGE